jgi:hypothetical protein
LATHLATKIPHHIPGKDNKKKAKPACPQGCCCPRCTPLRCLPGCCCPACCPAAIIVCSPSVRRPTVKKEVPRKHTINRHRGQQKKEKPFDALRAHRERHLPKA